MITASINALTFSDLSGEYYQFSGNVEKHIIFSGNQLTYTKSIFNSETGKSEKIVLSSEYDISSKFGIDYIQIKEDELEWLVIWNQNFLFLYDSDGYPFLISDSGETDRYIEYLNYFKESLFFTENFLVENFGKRIVEYPSSNLVNNAMIPFPWVEGDPEYGRGVKLHGTISKTYNDKNYYLYISNGYVSYERPDLYSKNCRVKEILVKNLSSGKQERFHIVDSPHLQEIDLSYLVTTNEDIIEIEITDVYKGSKYKDTCLNFLFTYED